MLTSNKIELPTSQTSNSFKNIHRKSLKSLVFLFLMYCLFIGLNCTGASEEPLLEQNCLDQQAQIWIAHGQSNIQGEQSPSGNTQGKNLAESIAMEFKTSQGLVAYDESNGTGIGEWNIAGYPSYVLAESKYHSWYYMFAKTYHALTNKQVIAVPLYRGATSLTAQAANSNEPDKYWINNPTWPGLEAGYAKISQARAALPNAPVYVYMYAGEYDAFALNSGNLSKANFKQQLRSHILDLIAQTGAQKVYASIMHDLANEDTFISGVDLLEEVQQELAQEMPKQFTLVYPNSRADLKPEQFHHPGDYIHLNAAGLDRLGEQVALGIAQDMGCYP
ncbi:SGNH/GDSL hydrolase family protein [bacterium]|nr:SGNH/GDSL hydrolase family protein [bacterium]